MLLWLHPLGKGKERDIEDFSTSWSTYCDDNNCILVCPVTDNMGGWTPADSDYVQQTLRSVLAEYTVDSRRIVAHGLGIGGEMAYYLGFHARSLVRGVATVGAHLAANPRERVANQPLSFFLVVGSKDPVLPAVKATKDKLAKYKYPVMLRVVENMGHEYLDGRLGSKKTRGTDALARLPGQDLTLSNARCSMFKEERSLGFSLNIEHRAF